MNKKSPKIVISGYYGFDNCGDEAVLLSIIHCLRKLRSDVKIIVLSGNPEQTRKQYGVDAVDRWNLIKVKFALLGAKLLISGGGSLIQDVTSARSPVYYLSIIRLALLMRNKVMIYSQGLGPLTHEKNRKMTGKVFSRCNTITVRDAGSADLLEELGVKKDTKVTSDPVMALTHKDIFPEGENIDIRDISSNDAGNALANMHGDLHRNSVSVARMLNELGIPIISDGERKPLLFVSIRFWKDDSHIPPIAECLDSMSSKGWDILLVPAHYPEDAQASAKLRNCMNSKPFIIDKCLSATEFLALTSLADRVLSMRLHGLICAMAMGTPMLGVSYDPKVDAFMEKAGLSDYCISFEDFNAQEAMAMMDALDITTRDGFESYTQTMEAHRQEMHKLAWDTARAAIKLL